MDRAVSFYGEVLGLRLLSRVVHEEVGEECVFFGLEGCTLELLRNTRAHGPEAGERKPSPLNCPHFCFATTDMDAVLRLLREKGIELLKPLQEIPGHARWIYFQDPDGNVLEFIEWLDR